MLNNTQVLAALIAHVDASDKPVYLGWNEIAQWQEGLLNQFVALRLISKDVNAKSLTCLGCEHHCAMDVFLADDNKRAFIVCDHPEMQDQMGRIQVSLERLQQWQVNAKQFAQLISKLLKIESKPEFQKEFSRYKLGMLESKKGRRWVTLNLRPLRLELGGHVLPLCELLFFKNDELLIDAPQVESLLNAAGANSGKAYTPNTNKQNARKFFTQAMYQYWYDAYVSLTLKHPAKTDRWYSIQISKMPIAQGKSAETIRKNMKK